MKVFVTGGTGFVGCEIVRQLHEAGHQVRMLVRRPSPAVLNLVEQFHVEIRQADLLDPVALPKAMQGMEAVIHLVGIISEFKEQTFENLHTRATQNVVQAALISGARRFVHMSALGTRANARSRYHQTKWAAEQAVSQSRLDWTIFRPSLIYGSGDQFVNLFARIAEWSPVMPVFAAQNVSFQPVAVEEAAQCFVRALDEPRAVGQTFDVCGPEKLSLSEIIQTILKVTKRKALLFHVPIGVSTPLAWATEVLFNHILGKAPPLNRDQLLMLQENNTGENRWTVELFKLEQTPPPPFAERIAKYLKYIR